MRSSSDAPRAWVHGHLPFQGMFHETYQDNQGYTEELHPVKILKVFFRYWGRDEVTMTEADRLSTANLPAIIVRLVYDQDAFIDL